jgi:uncharacterized protein YbjT (DUF2867 family)
LLIFITGATGFIGRALADALRARGHGVRAGVHHLTGPAGSAPGDRVAVDFTRDVDPAAWLPRLDGVDVVVNTVGILREHPPATFARVHVEAPTALFDACARRGIGRVIQLSALGADERAVSPYHRSKRDADAALLARIPDAACVQPSLVFGAQGASARLFMRMASLPLVPVPGRGLQRIQPIHLDDLVVALCNLIERPGDVPARIALVGPFATTLRDYLATLRHGLRLPPAPRVGIPTPVVLAAAAVGEWLPGGLLDRAALGMLARGNTADAGDTTRLLGHAPRPADCFIPVQDAGAMRMRARLDWLLPVLRTSVALVWIVTGILSFGVFPVAQSEVLLARTGVPAALAPLLLFGAASLDIVVGLLVFILRGARRRWLWRVQAALVIGYSAIIAARLPEFLVHPYGPVLKNLPLLAVLMMLDMLEERE